MLIKWLGWDSCLKQEYNLQSLDLKKKCVKRFSNLSVTHTSEMTLKNIPKGVPLFYIVNEVDDLNPKHTYVSSVPKALRDLLVHLHSNLIIEKHLSLQFQICQ